MPGTSKYSGKTYWYLTIDLPLAPFATAVRPALATVGSAIYFLSWTPWSNPIVSLQVTVSKWRERPPPV
jgi:hypothetical protein